MKRKDNPALTSLVRFLSLCVLIGLSTAMTTSAFAQDEPLENGDFAAGIVIDSSTGEVLYAKEPHLQRQPASMVKMMTELLLLEQIDEGSITLHDTVTVSAKASKMGGSQVYLKQGEEFSVEELLKALSIHSANDAAAALAEYHSGSTEAFVDLMNMRATDLGMNESQFRTVHGLPPEWNQEPDLSTVYDMAILGMELTRHPIALRWSNTATAPFRDGEFTLYNPNKLIGKFRGLDGLKTGFHSRAGYCITATAKQKGRRLISVLMGATSDRGRATETTRLLSYGFNMFVQMTLIERDDEPLGDMVRIKGGKKRTVAVAYGADLSVCVRRDRRGEILVENRLSQKVSAPVTAGQVVGKAVAMLGTEELGEAPIIALEDVPKGNWFQQLFNK
jgi:serine-type D-Ala-D-Ala carboxypeptidase (penicillin-binding protein 5/6)